MNVTEIRPAKKFKVAVVSTANITSVILLLATFGLGACAAPSSKTASAPLRPKPSNPIDAYYLRCQDIIEPFWRRQSKQSADLLGLGTVVLVFEIPQAGGHARGIKVTSGTSPEALTEVAIVAVAQAVFPPMPRDVRAVRNNRPFWVEYSFTVHS